MVHALVKKLGYDSYFQMFKSFAVDAIILFLLWTAGQEIAKLDISCETGVKTDINPNETFENVTLEIPNSYIETVTQKYA